MTAERRAFINMWPESPPGFFSMSSLKLKAKIDYKAYEESQKNIQLMIHRLSYRRGKSKTLGERMDYQSKISKLRAIDKDLQKALES